MHDEGLLVYSRHGVPAYKGYLDTMKGTTTQDVWTDIPPLMGSSQERLGYPTQKPVALLERILLASSREGAVVLDPFCGCGTTIDAAQRLGRRWIGIDVTHLAIGLIKHRLADTYGPDIVKTYKVSGSKSTSLWKRTAFLPPLATTYKRTREATLFGRLYSGPVCIPLAA
jgi:hypothetical protein